MISVSVIMYVKNGMPYFERALKSVLSQTLSNIEILVVDGGSTDKTLELVSRYQEEDQRIRLLHCGCGSVGAQFNLGVRAARGEYIGIVESDDYILPTMYEIEYHYATERNCDVLRADNYIFFNLGEQEVRIRTNVSHDRSIYGRRLQAGLDDAKIQIGGSYWTGLYKRSYLLKYQIRMNESKGAAYQDFGFLFLASAMAESLYFLDEAFYCYRKDNPNSSCNRPMDIHMVHREYDFLKSELMDRGLWERSKYYYYLWKIRNERWFYHNLRPEDQKRFLPYFYQDLRKNFGEIRDLKDQWNQKEGELLRHSQESEESFRYYLKKCGQEWKTACAGISALSRNNTVYIFGAGNIGRIICQYLQDCKAIVKAYIDNNTDLWGKKQDGIGVIPPNETRLDGEETILICSENYADEIRMDLIGRGVKESRMLICNDMDACIRFIMGQMKGEQNGNILHCADEDLTNKYEKEIRMIYELLGDERSKFIYRNRLSYSITGDEIFLQNIVDHEVRNRIEWQEFRKELLEKSKKNKLVIYGAGIWGRILWEETRDIIDWNLCIDIAPEGKDFPVRLLCVSDFLRSYKEEYIVISSFKNYGSMYQKLMESNIPPDRIIDAGRVINLLTEGGAYFDFKKIQPIKEEVFVDGGSYDGFTTKAFFQWTNGNGYAYCFEMDPENIERIHRTLSSEKYEILSKALWSEKKRLSLCGSGNFASSVTDDSEESSIQVEADAMDTLLCGKKVTYIKMDIEGAELEAIKGARKIIQSQSPRLAVSVYHKREDIVKIPALLHKYHNHYKFYLRHYSFSYYDTVLYALEEGEDDE